MLPLVRCTADSSADVAARAVFRASSTFRPVLARFVVSVTSATLDLKDSSVLGRSAR